MPSRTPVLPELSRAAHLRPVLTACLAAGLGLFFAGCATTPVPRGSQMVVTSPAEFFRNGPAQDAGLAFDRVAAGLDAAGPDFQLESGAMVTVVQREFGFSKVRTAAGDVGYVANEQLRPAPVIARVTPSEERKPRSFPTKRRSAPSSRPPVEQLDLSDIPLPLPS